MEAKKIILLLMLLPACLFAQDLGLDGFRGSKRFIGKCDYAKNGSDGFGGFLAKNGDSTGKLVVLTDDQISFDRLQTFKFFRRSNSEGVKRTRYRKIQNLRYTGRANGNRQHWRDDFRNLADYPRRRVLFRGRIRFITAITLETGEVVEKLTEVFPCYFLSRVDSERND